MKIDEPIYDKIYIFHFVSPKTIRICAETFITAVMMNYINTHQSNIFVGGVVYRR